MHSTRIGIIQFRNTDITATLEKKSIARELGSEVVVVCLSALDDKLFWNEPEVMLAEIDGIIFGGSGDYDFDGGRPQNDVARTTSYALLAKLQPLLDYIFTHDIPTLGICYGHQIIGAYAGAQVVNDLSQKKSCSHEVAVLVDKEAYSICAGVPDIFPAHYGHKDSLDRVPNGAVLLMSGGDACKVSALCYKKNIFTTQFHPELTIEDMRLRMAATPGYLPEDVDLEKVFCLDCCANLILHNFGKFVQGLKNIDV